VARELIDALTRVLGWLRRSQRVTPPPGELKVNLGSSLLVADGWLNVDGSLGAFAARWPRPVLRLVYRLSGLGAVMAEDEYVDTLRGHRFVHHDLGYGIPLPDGCAAYVFSSHFLEHLSRESGERLLREVLRVLRPGGVVRIAVPDLADLVRRYEAGDKAATVEDLFDEGKGHFARHRFMYDEEMLAETLRRAGFADPRRCEFREGRVPDLDVLDNRPGSLVMEAERPVLSA
jgi:SAM-dependent methyltransferase